MKNLILLFVLVLPAVSQIAIADTIKPETLAPGTNSERAETIGLYYISNEENAPSIEMPDGSRIRLGAKAEIQIHRAQIYSENNENTEFRVRLETTEYPVDPKTGSPTRPVALRIGEHAYASNGWGGKTGAYNLIFFQVHSQDAAKAIALSLKVECDLRTPPGYKFSAQFVPAKSEFSTNEPVLVKFVIKNLDERTISFQRGGQQRGSRDNQYGFRAMLSGRPVADAGNPMHHGGLSVQVALEPGKEFTDQIDLKKWFAFDQAGTYVIHGFYGLAFHRPGDARETYMPWNLIWSDYASADFTVVVK